MKNQIRSEGERSRREEEQEEEEEEEEEREREREREREGIMWISEGCLSVFIPGLGCVSYTVMPC